MGTKTGLIIGLSVGFVLGARAGRERYLQIVQAARRLRQVPIISRPIDAVAEKVAQGVRTKGNEITDAVADVVKEKLFGVSEETIMIHAEVVR